jgi:hypothetical protein
MNAVSMSTIFTACVQEEVQENRQGVQLSTESMAMEEKHLNV